MFAAQDRALQDAAVSSRTAAFAAPARISSNPRQHVQNARPLFSYSYKTLLPQLPCFEIDAKPPGVYPLRFAHRAANEGCTCSARNRMNTYSKCAANPRGMRTCKIIELKASCNEHLQKNGGRGVYIVTQRLPPARRHRQANHLAFPVASGLFVPSSAPKRKSTPVFSCACTLFIRSFAPERKSTPLLSCASARFCRMGDILSTTKLQPLREILHSPVPSVVGCTCSPRKRL
jgi:hypothetical protein